MEDRKQLHLKIVVNLLLTVAAILLAVFALPKLIRILAPLIIAWIVALIANPLIRFLENRIKIMRKHGSVIVIVLVLTAIGFIVYGGIAFAVSQASAIVKDLPAFYQGVMENLQQAFQNLHQRYHIIPANIQSVINVREGAINEYIMGALKGLSSSPVSTVGNVASSLADILVLTVLTIIASYFMTVEKENITKTFHSKCPDSILRAWDKLKKIFGRAIGGYFLAHLKIMAIIFVILLIPFALMKVKYFGLVAALIAFVDFLPVFGAGTIIIPWALYQLITGSYRTALILVVLYVVIMIVRQFLEPKMISDSIGISAFQTLVFMIIGYQLGGMWGLILAIPAGMALIAFYEEGMFDRLISGIKILARDINEYRKY